MVIPINYSLSQQNPNILGRNLLCNKSLQMRSTWKHDSTKSEEAIWSQSNIHKLCQKVKVSQKWNEKYFPDSYWRNLKVTRRWKTIEKNLKRRSTVPTDKISNILKARNYNFLETLEACLSAVLESIMDNNLASFHSLILSNVIRSIWPTCHKRSQANLS